MSLAVPTKESIYRFDDIVVDCENFRVQKNGQTLTLTPRAFDVLAFLIANSGKVVEKQQIFESVWKDTFVGDNALTKIIKEIRHALDDSATVPRYIETVPKRGYRFIAEVEGRDAVPDLEIAPAESASGRSVLTEDTKPAHIAEPPAPVVSRKTWVLAIVGVVLISSVAAWFLLNSKPAEDPSSPIRSIAVLPFKPIDTNSRDESLEMGMAETLITRLSSLRQVAIRPMSAVRRFSDPSQDPIKAGEEMQVEGVLDGSIQKVGDRIRVTVRFIDIRNGTTLWSEQFDQKFTDIFGVQDSIAEQVTNSLTIRLSRQEQEQLTKHYTDNPEAYQYYLNAQLLWHGRRKNWIEQSLAFYKQAVETDPNFALAYIGMADAYIMLNGHRKMPAEETEKNARSAIMKALEIDSSLAQAHNALAELKYQFEYDWNGASEEFAKAIELNPNVAWIRQAHGWYLMSLGQFDDADAEMEKARELDPNSLTVNVGRGRLFYYRRQYDAAISHFRNLIAVEPNDPSLHFALIAIYSQKGAYPEAVESWLTSQRLTGSTPERMENYRAIFESSGWDGILRKRLENFEKQVKTGNVDSVGFANVYVSLGDKEKALFWLERAVEAREPAMIQLKVEPAYDSLRDDPRYAEMLRKIGLQS